MLGIARLNEHGAGPIASTRAPGDLHQDLEGSLRRTVIGHRERGVGVDDADERHARQIVALGDHLRADEDVHFARAHALEHALRFRAGRDVAIEPRHARRGKRLFDGRL
jgi:hypothetical protein